MFWLKGGKPAAAAQTTFQDLDNPVADLALAKRQVALLLEGRYTEVEGGTDDLTSELHRLSQRMLQRIEGHMKRSVDLSINVNATVIASAGAMKGLTATLERVQAMAAASEEMVS